MDRDTDEENAGRGTGGDDAGEDSQFRVIRAAPAAVVDPEDEEFTAAFDRLMAESVQQRNQETVKPVAVEIPLPSNIRTKLAARTHFGKFFRFFYSWVF